MRTGRLAGTEPIGALQPGISCADPDEAPESISAEQSTQTPQILNAGHTRNGVPPLSYHTRNRRDVPFTSLPQKGLEWYAHAVK